jgi:hypothetical protein
MKKKFKKKIVHINYHTANSSNLLKNIKLKKMKLTFITLPTPKQEQLAYGI